MVAPPSAPAWAVRFGFPGRGSPALKSLVQPDEV
jgi:hypothetical protein